MRLATCLLMGMFLGTSTTDAEGQGDPPVNFIDRWDESDVRIVSWNIQEKIDPYDSSKSSFTDVLTSLDPDIVVFQEIGGNKLNAQQLETWLDDVLPFESGWHVLPGISTGIRTVVASRWPLTMQRVDTNPPSSTRGVTMALMDLPDPLYPFDLYVMGVHFKAYDGKSNDTKRQRSADAIATWMGDARLPGRHLQLDYGTPMIIVGDMNLVGEPQPEITLLTGDVIEEQDFCDGVDIVKGDWDESDLMDLMPVDPNTGDADTYPSWKSAPWSRLDRFMFTDSAVVYANNYVLNALNMTQAQLDYAGLDKGDTSVADHLPIVMDLSTAKPAHSCLGDITHDGAVDISDLLAVIAEWPEDARVCCPGCPSDLNGDLVINVQDLLTLIGAWGACP